MTDLVGQILGNYRVEEPIGAGGMGQVFRGHHIHLSRSVGIKLLYDSVARQADFLERFQREAKASATLEHPHIVKVHNFGKQAERFYLVLELCARGSLRTLLQHLASMSMLPPLAVSLEIARQTADGLAYAHDHGMIHRDIKPDNILLEYVVESTTDTLRPRVKISDFGLAQLSDNDGRTATSSMMGTPAYMSPEQFQGLTLD